MMTPEKGWRACPETHQKQDDQILSSNRTPQVSLQRIGEASGRTFQASSQLSTTRQGNLESESTDRRYFFLYLLPSSYLPFQLNQVNILNIMPFPYKEINLNQKTTTIIVYRRYHLRVQKECTSSIESIVSTSNEQHPTSDYLAHSLCLSLQSGHRQLKIETSPATGEYNKHYTLHHRK